MRGRSRGCRTFVNLQLLFERQFEKPLRASHNRLLQIDRHPMADDLEKPIVQTAFFDALHKLGFGGAVLAVERYPDQLCSSLDTELTHARSLELVG